MLGSIVNITRFVSILMGSVVFVRLLDAFTDEPGNQNTQIAYTRSVFAACTASFGFVLSAVGFNAALDVQPAAVDTVITVMFIWVPVLIYAAVLIIYLLFFDKGL